MASKSKSENIKIERLNNINHRIWKRRITYLLTHEKTLYTLKTDKPSAASRNFVKWEEDNALAIATILNHMEDDLIPLYEGYDTAKEIMDVLDEKYGPKSQTYIQLLLEKYNGSRMNENDDMVDHITKMEVLAKDLSNAGHPIPDKMQVSTLLNSLPKSWDHVVTSLTYGQKELSMNNLPAILAVEKVRMNKRKKENGRGNLLIAEDSQRNKPQYNKRKNHSFFKTSNKKIHKFKGKKHGCYFCGEIGHIRAKCPKRQKTNDKPKELILTISEALIAEGEEQWCVDSGATRHVCKDKSFFININEKAQGEHRLYMGNNTYIDVLGEGDCKLSCNGTNVILKNVLYAPTIRRNLISVAMLEKKGFEVRFKTGVVTIGKEGRVGLN